MSIPYIINVSLSPFLGIAIDFYGRCASILVLAPLVFLAAHVVLATTEINAIYPLVGQGLAYSFYAAALWPMVVYVVDEKYVGVAYGVMTSVLNFGTAAFPLITSAIYIKSGNKYVPNTEWFFVGLGAAAFGCGVWLWVLDRMSGRELDRSHWNDKDAAAGDSAGDSLTDPLLTKADMQVTEGDPDEGRASSSDEGCRASLKSGVA
jgi:MFS family permease